jgi:class 3 adenylate cyclase
LNFDALQQSYWNAQLERVKALRDKISGRAAAAAVPGRIVPEGEDLAIGAGRRLPLAIMFLDISGFSNRSSSTQEQQSLMLKVLNLFFTEMMKIAEDYGGMVEKNTGDGLMAYFDDGGDVAASKKAVACAMTMMRANDRLVGPILAATPGTTPIEFRISIDYGPVTIARLGAAQRFNAYVAIGSSANFASKMLAHAKPGEIVLGADALNQLPPSWKTNFAELATASTGWTQGPAALPYRLYRFTGRWLEFPR